MPGKAIFLDRDDTITEDPGYVSSPEQLRLLPDAAKVLNEFRAMGYRLIVVSNQSGIARGMFTEETLTKIHERLKELLAEQGAYVDQIYYCPYHPEGTVLQYRKDSDLRKPNPGMLLTAAEEMDIDLSQSWMIGDTYADTTAGKRAGCRTILLTWPGKLRQPRPNEPSPDFKASGLVEAATIVRRHSTVAAAPKPQTQIQIKPVPRPPVKPQEPVSTVLDEVHRPKVAPPAIVAPQAGGSIKSNQRTEELLEEVIKELKASSREALFMDFSLLKLLAQALLVIVIGFTLAAVFFLLRSSNNSGAAIISLNFAILFQLMSLTFFFMHGRK
jgi:D-glycero-D-manno-heptose 1,7-bisphosphate phosphatase